MYSKDLKDRSLKTQLGKAIAPYKKFKKMYTIDKTRKYEGKLEIFTSHSFKD